MRWRIAGLVVILALVAVAAVALARAGHVPAGGGVPPVPTAQATYTFPTALPPPTVTSVATLKSTESPTPTTPPPGPASTPGGGTVAPLVDFQLTFQISGSGFGRTVNASLTNTGTVNAHNVTATLQLWAGSSRIKVNGQDMLVEDLGDLVAGATVSRTINITVSFLDGIKLQSSGGTITVDVVSDEGSKQFQFVF